MRLRLRDFVWRAVGGLCALVCCGGLWMAVLEIWEGLTTGRFRGRGGWIVREDRSMMFDIGMALNLLAAVSWIAFGALAIWLAFTGPRHRPWK